RRGSRVRVPSVPPLIKSPEHLLRAFSFPAVLFLLIEQKSSAFIDLFPFRYINHNDLNQPTLRNNEEFYGNPCIWSWNLPPER
ncbi:hypothetical protein, partial [Raoultella planticola]